MATPLISILMGVYNGEKTVRLAIDSILAQDFHDWEFVICDDGSTDSTPSILQSYTDPRIVRIRHERGQGLATALNRCIDVAKGQYLARQDADDFSHPDRLSKQLNYLMAHPEIDVLGTYARLIDEHLREWGVLTAPLKPTRWHWLRGSSILHPTVIMKRESIQHAGGYDPHAIRVEDYDLWMRMVGHGAHIETIPVVTYSYALSRWDYQKKKLRHRVTEFRYRLRGYRAMAIPPYLFPYALKPLLLGLIPSSIYAFFHRIWLSFKHRI